MKHPRWRKAQMYIDVFNHRQLIILRLFVIWQLASDFSIGHHHYNVTTK